MLTGYFSQPWPLVCSIRRVIRSQTEANSPAFTSPFPQCTGTTLLKGQSPGPGPVKPMEGPPPSLPATAQEHLRQSGCANWRWKFLHFCPKLVQRDRGQDFSLGGKSAYSHSLSVSPHSCSHGSAISGEPSTWPWLLLLTIHKQLWMTRVLCM